MSERETTEVCGACGHARLLHSEVRNADSPFPCCASAMCNCGVFVPVSRAAGGERAGLVERITAYLTGGGLFNPELANHEAVRDLLIACRDALSSAPAPEERHRRFAEAVNARISYDVQDSTVYVEFKSPRDAVAFEEAMRGCDRHPDPDFRPASSSPSGAGSPVAHRWERCSECGPMVICGHCGNNCCNGGSGDNCPDRCASAYAEQKAGWARLNASKAWHPAPPAAGREPREATPVKYVVGPLTDGPDYNAVFVEWRGKGKWAVTNMTGEVYGREGWEHEPMPSSRDDAFLARCRYDSASDALRAALGASAQTNTGEGGK